ncbi:hypothetical protein K2173_020793 [Erythroxylum novogranatense]|uniref:Uncharacterized protein n=1 Tax=Erythroxylum novogranatense TaxID=1862640 RepID=A0AAV8TPU4_9ROSI|nr:hypothetical protein K2173_020793 [Erythroxylum novogranatense]
MCYTSHSFSSFTLICPNASVPTTKTCFVGLIHRNKLSLSSINTISVRANALNNDDQLLKFKKSSALNLLSIFSSSQNLLMTTLSNIVDPPLSPSVDRRHVFTGNFATVDELDPADCQVVMGELPSCLNGTYLRNGPNPQHMPNGPLHFFEGDGMVHSLRLRGGQATYCSRYVKTYKYMLEQEAGLPIFPNILSGFYGSRDILSCVVAIVRVMFGRINLMRGFGLANTSLAFFCNKLLALGESDLPYVLNLTEEGDIQTLCRWEFHRKLFATMTAHPKVDFDTKETFAFSCRPVFPYITYFSFNQDGYKQTDVPLLSIDQPTLIHDFAITKRFAIFAETNLAVSPGKVATGNGMPVFSKPTKVPRIGIIPRYAASDRDMEWFEVPGFNAMHVVNAWENGEDEIVLVAPNALNIGNLLSSIETVHFSLEKLNINTRTGKVSRVVLSQRSLELPCINPSYVGKKTRYAYLGIAEKAPKMSGIVKIDLENGCEVSRRLYEPGCYGGEPYFVPKQPNNTNIVKQVIDCTAEDDGFLLNYVHDENSGESRFLVLDAMSPELEVVATIKMPRRVPYGFHGLFVRHV